MKDAVQILAISDDINVCNLIHTSLSSHGHQAICVPTSLDAIQMLSRGVRAEFVLIDVAKSQSNEQLFDPALLQMVRSEQLCLLTEKEDTHWQSSAANWNIQTVWTKPLTRHHIERLARWQHAAPSPSANTPSEAAGGYHLEELDDNRFFLAASPVMMQLYRDIRVLAPVDIPVLILGESGVGKEIVAMLLHKYHTRSENRFLNVNCAALPTELLESELFGYEAGAFTGAMKSKPGKFELANKGTLLLDEIGEMSPQMQAKLLHVLQDGSFCRLGGRSPTKVDVRVLAATNIDMQTAITEKRFREDLYYRLNTLTLIIPPLRERREEIPLVMEELNRRGGSGIGEPLVLSDRIFDAALEYHWPGNLRELRNFVIRTLILRDQESAYAYLRSKTQTQSNMSAASVTGDAGNRKTANLSGMKDAISEIKNQTEIRMLRDALSASNWNRRRAAMNLNISYRSLLYKIQQHGLSA
ncbi:DNA-binding NtrC family response regulator [Edaphobacter modestus]|uniref:DNA-binding NtrC family response regulator n=2 Tax=Edaphobacter modestus TaxID=388466 RepID=A0A4Q7YS14_9BACT|nr:DNA-binding NtrC family response regulator [Edaphobacter modestus]